MRRGSRRARDDHAWRYLHVHAQGGFASDEGRRGAHFAIGLPRKSVRDVFSIIPGRQRGRRAESSELRCPRGPGHDQCRCQKEDSGYWDCAGDSRIFARRSALRGGGHLEGGISIAEITMTVPGAIEVISELARTTPEVLVGAGTVLNPEAARRCLDAGAQFLVTPGLSLKTIELAAK